MGEIKRALERLADPGYRAFHSRLVPTVNPARILGVRTPDLRALAKQMKGSEEARAFLRALPHALYDEDCLHALLINDIADYNEAASALDAFLPCVDNWAVCDCLRPRALKAAGDLALPWLLSLLRSERVYTARFALVQMMNLFLKERFRPEFLSRAADVALSDYYAQMAVAWYFATALAFQYECALPYVQNARLSEFARKKAVQKALESFRVPEAHKNELRALRAARRF